MAAATADLVAVSAAAVAAADAVVMEMTAAALFGFCLFSAYAVEMVDSARR